MTRTLEAIYADFGRGKENLDADGFLLRRSMFALDKLDLTTQTEPPPDFQHGASRSKGGWTTEDSNQGLIRRLLHAMHSNDEFVVVVGGDAAAAGHGNHFRQTYAMHFHRILAPVFARMGVKLVTRNLSMGHSMGTIQSSLGFSSLVGQDIDVLIWDCEMTEGVDSRYAEMFFRQGLMSSGKQGKIPLLLLGGNSDGSKVFDFLRTLHNESGVNVAQLGIGTYTVPQTTSVDQVKTLRSVFQYINCTSDMHKECINNRHCTHCWIDRDDVSDPTKLFSHLEKENSFETPQGWWYPGWRQHILLGRQLAFFILDAMQDAIEEWSQGTMGGPPLDDDDWHVTSFYDEMREKVNAVLQNDEIGKCKAFALESNLPPRICSTPLQGATEYTPRPFPEKTSLIKLIQGDEEHKPSSNKKVLYEGQDVPNKCMAEGDIDVVRVANLRRNLMQHETIGLSDDLLELMHPDISRIHHARISSNDSPQTTNNITLAQRRKLDSIQLGKGWVVHGEKPGKCDGEYLSICGRDSLDTCPLLGYHDSRGELIGDDACDWLVFDLPNVKEGIVIAKVTISRNSPTEANRNRHLREKTSRKLPTGSSFPETDDFAFEFAIDGEITTLKKADLVENLKPVHRRMETVTLLDQSSASAEPKTVNVAMRVKGCRDGCIFSLSHLYWA